MKYLDLLREQLVLLVLFSGAVTVQAQNTYPYHFVYDGNPLVRNHGAADPDAHVWDDTIWLYCSQDHEVVDGDTYATMDGYHAFSSSDMVNWTDHGEVLHSRDVEWGMDGFMWAPGAARRNGKYYLYYPHKDKKEQWRVGVAISDVPQGPFKDIGHPIEGIGGIDPAVFIDDDGQAYLYNNNHIVAKLKPNMIELAESPRKIDYAPQEILDDESQRFNEGSYMHKRDGIYYYSYSNFHNKNYQGWYAMGDNPYGPFEWKGPMAPKPQGAQDHHSIIEFKGQWYYFYHIAIKEYPVNKVGQGRITCFDRLYYNEDGTIQMVAHTFGPTKILKTDATNGSIGLDPPGGAYPPGTEVKLTAEGALGYAFDSWDGDLSGSENPATIVMDADKGVSAKFVATPTFRLSIDSKNGSVLLNPPGGEYSSGAVVTLIPVDDFGYDFSTWGGDLAGTRTPESIVMNGNKHVKAHFNSVPTFSVTAKAENGIVELHPEGGVYEAGAEVELTAKSDYGHEFVSWSGDVSGTENPIAIAMNADMNVTATFRDTGKGKVVFATNCGGAAFRSEDGISFSADKYSSGGSIYGSGSEISGTKDPDLFRSERHGSDFGYDIPLPNGKYEVTLMFAEVFFNDSGKRVFNVAMEGVPIVSNFDIWSKVGRNAAYEETHEVSLDDGVLNITLTAIEDNAKISAIRVVKR